MDAQKPRNSTTFSPTSRMTNGYILPEGRVTPNALFVGGIDMKVNENDMEDLFVQFGSVKEVRIIRYRGGICKGYGFVYFSEDVNIHSIIEQQIIFRDQKLKLGPAIMKPRSSRSRPSYLISAAPWMSHTQYLNCSCCSSMGGGMAQPSPVLSGGSPYNQPYPYSSFGGNVFPQLPMNYVPNPYTYAYTPPYWMVNQRTQPVNETYVDCGGQRMNVM